MTTQRSKQLVRRLVDEAINRRDLDVLSEVAGGTFACYYVRRYTDDQ